MPDGFHPPLEDYLEAIHEMKEEGILVIQGPGSRAPWSLGASGVADGPSPQASSAPGETSVKGKRFVLRIRGSANWRGFSTRDGRVVQEKVEAPLSGSGTYGGNPVEITVRIGPTLEETTPPPGKAPQNSYSCQQGMLSGRWSGLTIDAVRVE